MAEIDVEYEVRQEYPRRVCPLRLLARETRSQAVLADRKQLGCLREKCAWWLTPGTTRKQANCAVWQIAAWLPKRK